QQLDRLDGRQRLLSSASAGAAMPEAAPHRCPKGAPVDGHLFTPREGICQLAIIGYGSWAERPGWAEGIPSSAVLCPGQVIVLRQAPPQRNSIAFIAGYLCGYACSVCSRHLISTERA
ncbi:unnamed protein product, partial [Symbiodinium necroappetens]